MKVRIFLIFTDNRDDVEERINTLLRDPIVTVRHILQSSSCGQNASGHRTTITIFYEETTKPS